VITISPDGHGVEPAAVATASEARLDDEPLIVEAAELAPEPPPEASDRPLASDLGASGSGHSRRLRGSAAAMIFEGLIDVSNDPAVGRDDALAVPAVHTIDNLLDVRPRPVGALAVARL
jgi:hypothetical protein